MLFGNNTRCTIFFALTVLCILLFFLGEFDIRTFLQSTIDKNPVFKKNTSSASVIKKDVVITKMPVSKEVSAKLTSEKNEIQKPVFHDDRNKKRVKAASKYVTKKSRLKQLSIKIAKLVKEKKLDSRLRKVLSKTTINRDGKPVFKMNGKHALIKSGKAAKVSFKKASQSVTENGVKVALKKDNKATKVVSTKDEKATKVASTKDEKATKVTSTKDKKATKVASTKDEKATKFAPTKDEKATKVTSTKDEKATKVALKKVAQTFINRKTTAPIQKSIAIQQPDSKKNVTFQYTIPPRAKNHARIIQNSHCLKREETSGKGEIKFVLVTNYIPINRYRDEYFINGRRMNRAEEEARIYEVLSVFQKNLKHPLIKKLYIFVQHKKSVQFLQNTAFENSSKLVIVWCKKGFTRYTEFSYITKCLQGEFAMYTNMDIVIGEGFEKIDATVLKKNKLMYALTRYSKHEYIVGTCNAERYDMSHDTFVFFVRKFVPTAFDAMLDMQGNEYGIESVTIHTFRELLGYTVLNSCKVLHTYHEHQVLVRRRKRRLDVKQHHNAVSGITDRLS